MSQAVLDRWFEGLEEVVPGVRKFGVQTYEQPPRAAAPTLVIYAGHAAVDLGKLVVPENLAVSTVGATREGKGASETPEKLNRFLNQHQNVVPQGAGPAVDRGRCQGTEQATGQRSVPCSRRTAQSSPTAGRVVRPRGPNLLGAGTTLHERSRLPKAVRRPRKS